MASTFKTLLNDDVVSTRTLLHEAIPITGTIVADTDNTTYAKAQIKTYTHGMFESTFDYPYLSSSANHIFDMSFGHHESVYSALETAKTAGTATPYQNQKKRDIYNQFAQVLMGYDETGSIRHFDSDGTLDDGDTGKMTECFFLSFSRLLVKDEIKKNSFRLQYRPSGTVDLVNAGSNDAPENKTLTLGDYASANEYYTSPAGDYSLIFTASADSDDPTKSVGLVFYQAGVVVLSSSMFSGGETTTDGALSFGYSGSEGGAASWGEVDVGDDALAAKADGVQHCIVSGSIENAAQGFRNRWIDCDFNNTIELNSTIYFARINHNEFNYSANPTYVSGSKLVVKNNVNDLPVTYITTVGLYSPDNELLACAKVSEPIRKDPNTELTLRVRLDY